MGWLTLEASHLCDCHSYRSSLHVRLSPQEHSQIQESGAREQEAVPRVSKLPLCHLS